MRDPSVFSVVFLTGKSELASQQLATVTATQLCALAILHEFLSGTAKPKTLRLLRSIQLPLLFVPPIA